MEDVGEGLVGGEDLPVQLQSGPGAGGRDADLSLGQNRSMGRTDDLSLLAGGGRGEQTEHYGGNQGSHRWSRQM